MLQLVKLNEEYKHQLHELMDEWTAANEKIVPFAIRKNDYHDFQNYVNNLDDKITENPNLAPSTTYFCLDTDRNIFVGAVNIRHNLNDILLQSGGRIGDGIRPSERRKGFGTQMLKLALDKCREMGIEKVLIICDKENIASAKTITNNGGRLENEIMHNGTFMQRYWIQTADVENNLEVTHNRH